MWGACAAQKNRVILPLRKPEYYTSRLVRQVKGVLLYGPPGTGKTMLAKVGALASMPCIPATPLLHVCATPLLLLCPANSRQSHADEPARSYPSWELPHKPHCLEHEQCCVRAPPASASWSGDPRAACPGSIGLLQEERDSWRPLRRPSRSTLTFSNAAQEAMLGLMPQRNHQCWRNNTLVLGLARRRWPRRAARASSTCGPACCRTSGSARRRSWCRPPSAWRRSCSPASSSWVRGNTLSQNASLGGLMMAGGCLHDAGRAPLRGAVQTAAALSARVSQRASL